MTDMESDDFSVDGDARAVEIATYATLAAGGNEHDLLNRLLGERGEGDTLRLLAKSVLEGTKAYVSERTTKDAPDGRITWEDRICPACGEVCAYCNGYVSTLQAALQADRDAG